MTMPAQATGRDGTRSDMSPDPTHLPLWSLEPGLATALNLAFELAAMGPAHGPNPRVGCVILDTSGQIAGRGFHRGAGHPHAEVEALADAEANRRPVEHGTVVTTLEPCAHTGRTPPCAKALIRAKIDRLAFAIKDPSPQAGGGGRICEEAGIDVAKDLDPERAGALNHAWLHAIATSRPFVTLKTAATLDGKIAASDETSKWITSFEARIHAHLFRAQVDAIVIGTGTALKDDPALTARRPDGRLASHQPYRVVVGETRLPEDCKLKAAGGRLITLHTRRVHDVLSALDDLEVRHLLLEGGARLAASFIRAGAVDEIHAYIEPMFLGAGLGAVGDFGVATLAEAPRWATIETKVLGTTAFIAARKKGA